MNVTPTRVGPQINCVHYRDGKCLHSAAQRQPVCRQGCVLAWGDGRIGTCTLRWKIEPRQTRIVGA